MRVQPSLKPKEEETSEVCSSVSHVWASVFNAFDAHFCNDHIFIYHLLLSAVRLSETVVAITRCYGLCLASDLTDSLAFWQRVPCFLTISPLFYLYVAIIMLIVCIKYKKFTSVVPCSINVFIHCANIYMETVHLIHIHTHTHYFYSLHNSVHIGLILITLMYLNCASNTRNIQVSDQDSVLADTQYSITRIGSGAQKTWSGHPYFILNIVKWVPNSKSCWL